MQHVQLDEPISHSAFGKLVGVSRQRIDELMGEGVLADGAPLSEWLLVYCKHLREGAAGRGGERLKIVDERARLASEQADRVAMENAVTRGELAPRAMLEQAAASFSRQVVAVLEALPGQVKRRSRGIKARELQIISEEVDKARNEASKVRLGDGIGGPES